MFIAWGSKIIQAMDRIESTLDEPLLFLKRVIQPDGEEYLRFLFENPNESNCWFNQETGNLHCIKILPWDDTRGILLDGETNEREYELNFYEFILKEFEEQCIRAHTLIKKQSKLNGKDQDAKLYSMVLIDCLELQKAIDSDPDNIFSQHFNQFLKLILTFVYRKFEKRYPSTPEIRRVKSYYLKRKESNLTGFRLKQQKKNATLNEFISYLRMHDFVTNKTKSISIFQFFQGEIPKQKIDWAKDLHELKYFIDQICNDEILHKRPGQPLKHLNCNIRSN